MSTGSDEAVDVHQVRTLLEQLVRIPSTNPPGGELPVAELLAKLWEAAGYEVSVDAFAPGRANVIGRRRWGPGPALLLNGHMDVQPPGQGWTHDPFAADVDDDQLFGQGAEDMKGGLAALTVAAVNYANRSPDRGELILTAVADEMSGGVEGTGRLVHSSLQADYAIVCEPTGSEIYLAHRGALWLELSTRGRSAHGGRPWLGRNAINAMMAWLAALQEWAPTTLRRTTHPLLPDNTMNVGSITGGHKTNVVADLCTAQIDLRFLPGQQTTEIVDQVRAIGERVAGDNELGIEQVKYVEPMETPESNPLVDMCRRAFRAVKGVDPPIGATAGFQDAHFLANDLGITTVMFGPYTTGKPDDPYPTLSAQPDEWVSLMAVAGAARVYEELIDEVLNS